MVNKVKVSILCLSFNHARYIGQALEGFISQKTDFRFEVLINDDHSTDGTKEIIKEYQKKYPDIIKPIFHNTNKYSKGERNLMFRYLFPEIKGSYIALCEGDDYWTDKTKLQKQADYLDDNSECSLVFHRVLVKDEESQKSYEYPNVPDARWYTKKQLLKLNYIQTNSVMYRAVDYSDIKTNVMPTDWYLHLFHAKFGSIKYMKDVMSVYRKHREGMWRDYDINRDKIWEKHGVNHLRMWVELKKLYDKKSYVEIIDAHITDMIKALLRVDKNGRLGLMSTVQDQFPVELLNFTKEQTKLALEVPKLEDEVSSLGEQLKSARSAQKNLQDELNVIKSSRIWRIRTGAGKVLRLARLRKKIDNPL